MKYVKDYAPIDRGMPLLRANMVTSLDGAASVDGHSGGLGGPADHALMQVLRMLADVIMVGAGTVRAEGYTGDLIGPEHRRWRIEHGLPERPRLLIISRGSGEDAAGDRGLGDRGPSDRVARERVASDRVARERVAGDGARGESGGLGRQIATLERALNGIQERGETQILCEGGPHLLGSLAELDMVDELCLTAGPVIVGPGPGRITAGQGFPIRRMKLLHAIPDGDLLFLRYARHT